MRDQSVSNRFEPALVIPCYNHGPALVQVLADLVDASASPLPTIVVDDGSEPHTAALLDEMAQRYGWLTLLRLPENLGKGGAVLAGLQAAAAQGFTHGVQLDADGQHDLAALPVLLATARAEPQALVSGQPLYDASVPKGRLYGRYVTHFWVWLETGSLAIRDSMCGFRVYPLAVTLALAARRRLGLRMDFDTEVMVRLYWQGVPVRFVPLRVIYPEQGLSHFDLWRDNLRISLMHTRLVCERLLYLLTGGALRRRHWSTMPERGAVWGMQLMLWSYRWLGRRGFRALLYPVIGYFWLTGRRQRLASADYLARLCRHAHMQGVTLPAEPLTTFRHFFSFGESLLDKLAGWRGEITHQQISVHGAEPLLAHLAQKQGVLLLGSHLGNLELFRALGSELSGVTINALVFTEHASRFNELLQRSNDKVMMNLIPVTGLGPETAFLIKEKLEAGEWVVVLADRTSATAEPKVVRANFLGSQAPFPLGPFALASVLDVPVFLLFGLKERGEFHLYFEPFCEPLRLPRAGREAALQRLVQHYGTRLQHYCCKAPLDWFNFFDFWHLSDDNNK